MIEVDGYVNNLLGDYGKGSTAVVSYKDVFNGMDRYEVVLTLGSETRTTMVVSYDLSAEETALAAINEADVGDMGTAITTNAEVLGLTLTDYTALTDKAPVHTALVDKSFADKAAVKSAFDTAVEAQKSAEAGQAAIDLDLEMIDLYHPTPGFKIPFGQQGSQESRVAYMQLYDGQGYPNGYSGQDIPLIGRICAVADAYVHYTSLENNLRLSRDDAINEILKASGTKFDPIVVDAFIKVIQIVDCCHEIE